MVVGEIMGDGECVGGVVCVVEGEMLVGFDVGNG